MKKNIPSTYLIFLALFAFSGLGWIFAAFLFGRLAVNDVHQVLSSSGYELGKTVFIGSTVGIFISSYLKRILQGSGMTSLETLGIQNIYKTRSDAALEFLEIVKNSKNKRIDIMGISLREFLTGRGVLNDV